MTSAPSSQEQAHGRLSSAPYILRPLISNVPLSADGDQADIRITCVEVLNENLYIGTSAGEVLHFVQIPPDPADPSGQPDYIIASRQQPPTNNDSSNGSGVQQILLLPTVHKACILNCGTLSFYSLPELSPTFPGTKPFSCVWVDGVDQNFIDGDDTGEDGVVVMLCLKNRIRLVRITDGEQSPARVRDISLGGCLVASRRGDFACVADANEYSLLDVVHQQRIPLFPISTVQELEPHAPPPALAPPREQLPTRTASRSVSTSAPPPSGKSPSHGRSSSLNILGGATNPAPRPTEPHRPLSGIGRFGFDAPPSLPQSKSPRPGGSPERSLQVPKPSTERRPSIDKALPPPPPAAEERTHVSPPRSIKQPYALHPHIVTPTQQEYLLATGTSPTDPGVGMFVNLDGDVVRGTIEFTSYPISVAVDGKGIDMTASTASASVEAQEEGNVLAIVRKQFEAEWNAAIEIQRWDLDPTDGPPSKALIKIRALTEEETSEDAVKVSISMRTMYSPVVLNNKEVGQRLALRSLLLEPDQLHDTNAVAKREREELQFSNRLGQSMARILLYDGNEISWLMRNPYVLQLDAQLDEAVINFTRNEDEPNWFTTSLAESVINDLRGLEPRTEIDFIGFAYLKQKAAFILFANLILASRRNSINEHIMRTTNDALLGCDLDPRITLTFLPLIRKDIVLSKQGLWISGGLHTLVEAAIKALGPDGTQLDTVEAGEEALLEQEDVVLLVRSYLTYWRSKKGFGSVADAAEIFATLEIALIHILLILDKSSPRGPAVAGSLRAELNAIVDSGVDNFDRAVSLLEEYQRLYIVSRLHQSRKNSAKVLETWRRIIEGETDKGGELIEGESEVRRYLSKLSNRKIVEEYGAWLASRNPRLGVQVFADDHARVTFKPAEALSLLRDKAPDAVKDYLEYLVFGKKQAWYANELISYYLSVVLDELSESPESRRLLLQSYETYRALVPPKPTYRDFITDNAIPTEWWHSRLRLLQLLGGGIHVTSLQPAIDEPTASGYDANTILKRLQPYEKELVPEMIILYGQQQRHEEAIRLLVQGLGDFDTAIRYCLLGGSSLFSSTSDTPQRPSNDEQARLFGHLLHEFLALENLPERVERTGELLERFGAWFEIEDVLARIPDSWSVEIVSSFIVRQLRRLVHERAETTITRALNGALNLKTSADVIGRIEQLGSVVEPAE